MRRVSIVFLGGGIGACLRGAALLWLDPARAHFPWPVLLVNVSGAFILGVLFVLANEADLLRLEARLFLAVGVLGGFTTFSTFAWGADLLLARGNHLAAGAAYLIVSTVVGVLAVWAGVALGRELVRMLERSAVAILDRLAPHRLRGDGSAKHDVAVVETENREEPA